MIGDRRKCRVAFSLRLRDRGDVSVEFIAWEILRKRPICCEGEEAMVFVKGPDGTDRGPSLVMVDVHQLGTPVTRIA